jgi:hypothetical protein
MNEQVGGTGEWHGPPSPLEVEQRETIKSLLMDNKALTNGLQRIEAGEDNPREIASKVLDRPSWAHLYDAVVT